MAPRRSPSPAARFLLPALLSLLAAGCSRDTTGLESARGNTDPVVFYDGFGTGVIYQPFLNTKVDAVSVDAAETRDGRSSLKVVVPDAGDPSGWFSGGAFTCTSPRDLADYNALVFWAKASRDVRLDVVGIGNDNTGTSKYTAQWSGINLTTEWARFIVPIPITGKLLGEKGLFFFAEGAESGVGCTMWFNDVEFASLDTVTTITNPRSALLTRTVDTFVGADVPVTGTRTVFRVNGVDELIDHAPAWFDYTSSDPAVASVSYGVVHLLAGGTSAITARLGPKSVAGTLTVRAMALPATPAPTPTLPAADVISLFSNAYANHTVDTWSAGWDAADVADAQIAGNDIKVYTNLSYAGIEFTSSTVDATDMTAFHLDVWVPAGNYFRVKLVDFGADGVYSPGVDDSEQELTFNATTTPALALNQWVALEIPFSSFNLLASRAHLAQIVLSGDTGTVYLDNVYFHR